ncbi:FecCD family ABC transporter permease [Alkalicoccobacillus murimartini]|uniref:Probable heme-iron transport system permease protein IsdF n=1 Tax=Alkalicoccobacillus murimartini TaxID=171685 RepID=A0ABT9YJ51_9BACI|nr:iron ABC transporter permease [Alkalicoccobacillus murimartini]MDQ0207746.1 iron complex transport system permease protein [Alkalicoccobacillus murimartini]
MKYVAVFGTLILLISGVLYWSVMSGSIQVPFTRLIQGVLSGLDDEVNVIYDLRFPRIIVASLAGGALAVSGALLQAVMRNPLADASIIGISSGANFTAILAVTIFPQLFFYMPLFAFIGGMIACVLVYSLSWKGGLSPMKLILVGVAIHATFTGLSEAFNYRGSYSVTSISTATTSTLSMKTWSEANMMMIYGGLAILIALCLFNWCNMLVLDDRTSSSLGLHVMRARIIVSVAAVILAATATAVAGVIAFLGLLVPHIGRQLVGSDYKLLLPFSAIGGAFLLLLADTIGRTILAPNEIPASILMAVIGGPFLIFLLRKSGQLHGHS